jgi:YidC/Oxa1 family membrane protein insertase
MQTQKILLYVLPFVFLISGVSFPLGVMTYWLVSNFWTMGQQFLVIRNMPTPGSIAHKEREARLVKKGKIKLEESTPEAEVEQPTQRQQPVGKNRAKKKKK